jgi:hypothetical protein
MDHAGATRVYFTVFWDAVDAGEKVRKLSVKALFW